MDVAATGTYTINSDIEFGALNIFEINAGHVIVNGVLSGTQGLVKSGTGALTLANDNTFTKFLALQDGLLRIEGSNAYTGNTTVNNGSLIVAADAGLLLLERGGQSRNAAGSDGLHARRSLQTNDQYTGRDIIIV